MSLKDKATVDASLTLVNDGEQSSQSCISFQIDAPDGSSVATTTTTVAVPQQGIVVADAKLDVTSRASGALPRPGSTL